MYKLDEETEAKLALLKESAGSWEYLAKYLYQIFPDFGRDSVIESIESNEAFHEEQEDEKDILKKVAISLFGFIPTFGKDTLYEHIQHIKKIQGEPCGRPREYTYHQILGWNRRVEEYCKKSRCSRATACKNLIQSGAIKLPKGNKSRSTKQNIDRLYKKLEKFRAQEQRSDAEAKLFLKERDNREPKQWVKAILQDTTDSPEN